VLLVLLVLLALLLLLVPSPRRGVGVGTAPSTHSKLNVSLSPDRSIRESMT
jgi:hypothetical protein